MRTILSFVVFWMACAGHAADLPSFDVLRVGSKTYKGVKVTLQEPSGIRFTHEAGAARASFEELEPEVRAKFNYDPKAAEQFETAKSIETSREQTRQIQAKNLSEAKKLAMGVTGRVLSITSKGVLITDAKQMLPNSEDLVDLPDESAFVICNSEAMVNGQTVSMAVFPRGTYEYTALSGAQRRVKCFTTNFADFWEWLAK